MGKPKTNVQKVKNIMEFSAFGPMAQLFVMDALLKQSNLASKMEKKDWPKNSFVSYESWVGVAKEIKEKLEAK
ncbi:MAG: hypothetical protein PHN88_16165 [Ignavibacteria bacterium]|nr:hypothetical protein [Ignavibacteria bacterium]